MRTMKQNIQKNLLFGWIGFATRALNNAEIKQKGKSKNE
jgi:hypothetical protein